jgi:LPXTG-motif cell wall-anchored protein
MSRKGLWIIVTALALITFAFTGAAFAQDPTATPTATETATATATVAATDVATATVAATATTDPAAATATPAATAAASPSTLPTTGGNNTSILFVALGLGALALIAGLALRTIRQGR